MLTVIAVTQPANGTVIINPDGTVTYRPKPGFRGVNRFTYTISDGAGGTDVASISVTVKPFVVHLAITKRGPAIVNPGTSFVYRIHVINNGPDDSPLVKVSDALRVLPLSITTSQGSCSSVLREISCALGTLVAGASADIQIGVRVGAPGRLQPQFVVKNTATVSGPRRDPVHANNTSTVGTIIDSPTADLSVRVAASPDPVTVGQPLTYLVRVRNRGPDTPPDVHVSATVPPGATLVSSSPSQGSCERTVRGPDSVVCALGSVAPGGMPSVTIVVIPSRIGEIVSRATVGSATVWDSFWGNNAFVVSTRVRR